MSARVQVTFPVLNEEALLASSMPNTVSILGSKIDNIYDLDEALPSPSEKVA